MNRNQLENIITAVEYDCNPKNLRIDFRTTLRDISDKFRMDEVFGKGKFVKNFMLEVEYYKRLISLFKHFPNKEKFLELGTQTGASSAIAAQFFKEVFTCDTDDSVVGERIRNAENIHFTKLKDPNEFFFKYMFSNYDIIFVDIDHSGDREKSLDLDLMDMDYKGIVLWDDINYNTSMKKFWDQVPDYRKFNLHHWHPDASDINGEPCGFGITFYE